MKCVYMLLCFQCDHFSLVGLTLVVVIAPPTISPHCRVVWLFCSSFVICSMSILCCSSTLCHIIFHALCDILSLVNILYFLRGQTNQQKILNKQKKWEKLKNKLLFLFNRIHKFILFINPMVWGNFFFLFRFLICIFC